MGEKTAYMFVLLVTAVGLLPILFTSFTNHVEGSKILNISTEFQQLVSAEGGNTPKVQEVIDKYGGIGLDITIRDESGSVVSEKAPVGEKLTMTYQYKGFKTENNTIILRR